MPTDKLKENLTSILRSTNPNATVKNIEYTEGNPEYMYYKATVEYKTPNETETKIHDVTILTTFSSDIPYSIDGKITKEGENHLDQQEFLAIMRSEAMGIK